MIPVYSPPTFGQILLTSKSDHMTFQKIYVMNQDNKKVPKTKDCEIS